jgi:hypothetical protein
MRLRYVALQNGLAILIVEDEDEVVLWQRMLPGPLDERSVEVIRELVEDFFHDYVSGSD